MVISVFVFCWVFLVCTSVFEGKGASFRYKIVCFVSVNYRGRFVTKQNLSVYAREVKNFGKCLGKMVGVKNKREKLQI